MNYRDYIFEKKQKTPIGKIIWKWIKICLYVFLIVSMLWGCGQLFSSTYSVWKVKDITGQSVYKPGVSFEIIINLFLGGKNHYFHIGSHGQIHEYPYVAINSWADAFTKTQSPFYGFFVYPIAWLLVKITNGFGGYQNGAAIIGSIFVTSLLVRTITLVFSFKAQMNQDKMQIVQLKQSEITAKYKYSKDPAAKQKQQLEVMALYKKEGMNPMASIAVTLLSFPFLIAMYQVIRTTRTLKVATVGQVSLLDQPWSMITSGHLIYLVILAVYLPLQVLSMFLPTILNLKNQKSITKEQKKARKKQYIIQGVMVGVFFIITISIAAGVAIYWIFSAVIQILQTLFFHWLRIYKNKNNTFISNISKKIKSKFSKEKTYEDELREKNIYLKKLNNKKK